MADDFSNDALVLIAHGSTVNAQSSAPTRRLAEELRAQNIFAEVACAFNLEQPKIDDVPKLVSAQRIFIVPVTSARAISPSKPSPTGSGSRRRENWNTNASSNARAAP